MSTLRQAAQRALKAMEDGEDRADMIEFSEALIALRAALDEPDSYAELVESLRGLEWAASGVEYMESEYANELSKARAALAKAEAGK